MGAEAARRALAQAGMAASEVDLLLVHTSISELTYPDITWLLARELGLREDTVIMGTRAVCAGFMPSLHCAEQFLRAGAARSALVVCTERLFAATQGNPTSAPIFGDGAAAAVFVAGPGPGLQAFVVRNRPQGMASGLMVNQHLPEAAWALACPDLERPVDHPVNADVSYWLGRDIFENAVQCMGDNLLDALAQAGLSMGDIDHFLLHQANHKILASVARRCGLPADRVHGNIARVGNISSATVPCLLSEGLQSGRIQRGDRVLMAAFGLGFTSAAAIMEV